MTGPLPPNEKPPARGGGGGRQHGGLGEASASSITLSAPERPLSRVLARLEELGCRPVGTNGTWRARCPAHDDRRPSLSIREGDDGRVLLKCHAGCSTEEVLAALGLGWGDLFPDGHWRNGSRPRGDAQAPSDPLSWWAQRCGVTRGWLQRLPIEARDGALAFTWPGLETLKLRSPDSKGRWEPQDAPRPPIWPAFPETLPPILVLCEGEGDATVAAYVIEAAGLKDKAFACTLTKGAGQNPDMPLLREAVSKGARALLFVGDVDEEGERCARAWVRAAQEMGLTAATLDLLERGLVSPSLGEKDLRDAFRRQRERVMEELRAAIQELAERAPESFPPIIEWEFGGNESDPFTTAADLLASPQSTTTWVWGGYLPEGGATLLSARAKGGKTTLVAHLLRALLQGKESFLGQPLSLPADARVAILSEEPEGLVAYRLRALGLESGRLLVTFKHRSQGRSLADLVQAALERGCRLVVVDTVAAWAGIEDENAAGEVEAALRPVISLCQERGAALLLLHHLRKSDGPEGTAHRGSGHLVAMVDVALELRRPEGNAPETRRVLRALSRYPFTPSELVIELQGDSYVALGTGQQVQHLQTRQALLDTLPGPDEEAIPFEASGREGETPPDAVLGRLRDRRLPRTTVQEALGRLLAEGLVERLGSGKRGDPYRYRLLARDSFPPNSHTNIGGNEFPSARGLNGQATVPEAPQAEAPSCRLCSREAEAYTPEGEPVCLAHQAVPSWASRVLEEELGGEDHP